MFKCDYCSNMFITTKILRHHQISVKYCLKIQEEKAKLDAMQAQEETSRGVEIYLAVTLLYAFSAFGVNRVMTLIEKRVAIPGTRSNLLAIH